MHAANAGPGGVGQVPAARARRCRGGAAAPARHCPGQRRALPLVDGAPALSAAVRDLSDALYAVHAALAPAGEDSPARPVRRACRARWPRSLARIGAQ